MSNIGQFVYNSAATSPFQFLTPLGHNILKVSRWNSNFETSFEDYEIILNSGEAFRSDFVYFLSITLPKTNTVWYEPVKINSFETGVTYYTANSMGVFTQVSTSASFDSNTRYYIVKDNQEDEYELRLITDENNYEEKYQLLKRFKIYAAEGRQNVQTFVVAFSPIEGGHNLIQIKMVRQKEDLVCEPRIFDIDDLTVGLYTVNNLIGGASAPIPIPIGVPTQVTRIGAWGRANIPLIINGELIYTGNSGTFEFGNFPITFLSAAINDAENAAFIIDYEY